MALICEKKMHRTVIVGGGAAGIAAAIAAAKNGAEVLLVESESGIGGDLFSGMPLLGVYTSLGKTCVHGILDEIIDICKKSDPDGYIGQVYDWRTVCGLCLDPEILRLAVVRLLKKYNVRLLLNSTVTGLEVTQGTVKSLRISGRKDTYNINCGCIIDATGGGNITLMAGGKVINGDKKGLFQPMSLLFRMAGVKFKPFLKFILDNPDEILLSENPVIKKTKAEAAQALYVAGYPYAAISAGGKTLGKAIYNGEVHPCTATFITPTSMHRKEVCINATRIAELDCRDDFAVSNALLELSEQVVNLERFFKRHIPGFKNSSISSIAHRVGIRETGRIKGEYTLTQDEVINAVRHSDCIALGCHHVDIHGSGVAQTRIPVKDGLAYDIPYRCLIPQEINNVIVAGRCLSSDRGANGSARVMGTCIATGQAAGMAAAIFSKKRKNNFRDIDASKIRCNLVIPNH